MAAEKDIVLIYFEDKPLTFARIEDISPDIKKDWYHVKLLILQVPLELTSWILQDIYIDGAEFTMDGKKVRLEKVVCPEPSVATAETKPKKERGGNKKVISLADLKKKDIS
jgi:hypothetical protein